MRNKKLLALGMASLMVMSSTCVAFADDTTTNPAGDTITGNGSIEGYIVQDVFTVTLPTVTNVSFKMDPQELLRLSGSSTTIDGTAASDMDADSYGSKVLFEKDSNLLTSSEDITIVNKSSYDVDVKVDISFTGLSKDGEDGYTIGIVDKNADDYTAGTNTDIYMSLTTTSGTLLNTTETKDTANATTKAIGSATYSATTTIGAAPEAAFEVTGTDKDSYKYTLIGDTSAITFNQVTYNLSGDLNVAADWTNFNADDAAALGFTFVYSVDKHVNGLSDGDTVNVASGETTKTLTIAGDSAPVSIWNGAYPLSGATISGNDITIAKDTDVNSTWIFNNPDTYALTVVLADNSQITINVVVAQ